MNAVRGAPIDTLSPTLREHVEGALLLARHVIESGRELQAAVYVHGDSGNIVAIAPGELMNSGDGKDMVADVMQRYAAKPYVRAVVFLSEAWMKEVAAAEYVPGMSIQRAEGRSEVVLIRVLAKDQAASVSAVVTRKPDKVGEAVVIPAAQSSGRFM